MFVDAKQLMTVLSALLYVVYSFGMHIFYWMGGQVGETWFRVERMYCLLKLL